MRTLLFSLLAVSAFPSALIAQAPPLMAYQAVVRNNTGDPLPNQSVRFRFTVHQTLPLGTVAYQETQLTTTNPQGLVALNVGAGTVTQGDFATIPWNNGPFFMEVELDQTGGTTYVSLGSTQLLSVPYALYAGKAASSTAQVPNIQYFASSGMWVKPPGLSYVIVEMVGGGGGGGAGVESGAGAQGGGGGGAGGYARKIITAAQLADFEPVTVGTGGAGGTVAAPHDGSAGGTSVFGSHCSATGGQPGRGDDDPATSFVGGAGGEGVNGHYNVTGGGGSSGDRYGGGSTISGAGGSNPLGGGGNGAAGYQSTPGAAGGSYGGGGGGGYDADGGVAQPGGTGANGVVIVTEYY